MSNATYIRFFDEVGIDDVPLVGGKNASLGEMYRELSDRACACPNGFAITADAYRHMLSEAGALERRCTTRSTGSTRRRGRPGAARRSARGRSSTAPALPG